MPPGSLAAPRLDTNPPPTGIDRLLARLNAEQRAAARHGLDGTDDGPLLIIAGAGTGKTNTLAHRVAHLVASGADPRRILLLTFSRRAAAEMTRRVGAHRRAALGERAARVAHGAAVGRHLPRRRRAAAARARASASASTRRSRSSTASDAADLMDLVRARAAACTRPTEPLPAQGHLPRDLLARRSTAQAPLADVLARRLPLVLRVGGASCSGLFAAYVEAKQRAARARLRRPAALLGAADGRRRRWPRDVGARFDHVLVDEYQDTNACRRRSCSRSSPTAAASPSSATTRRRSTRFRAATVRNILDFPAQFTPPARDRHARAELPLDAADPRRRQRGDRARRRALHQEPVDATARRRERPRS